MINAKTMSRTLIAGLSRISGFISCNLPCSICFSEVELKYIKHQTKVYNTCHNCSSLVCEKCAAEAKLSEKRCRLCLQMTPCFEMCKNDYSFDGKTTWRELHDIYTTFSMIIENKRFLFAFIHRYYGDDWLQVVLLVQGSDQAAKNIFWRKYLQFEKDFLKDFFRWKALFYTFSTLRYLPFKPTPQMLEWFDVEKYSKDYKIPQRAILKRFQNGLVVRLCHNFSLDENRTLFRRRFFLMILKRVLTKRLRW